MDIKRRNFLKIAGLTAIAGVGAQTAFSNLFQGEARASAGGGHGEEAAKGHGEEAKVVGKQMGMAINAKVFAQHPGLVEKCTNACHRLHNVPDYGNKKDEIKWIWPEPFEHAFPDESHYKKNTELHKLPFVVMCNHCANPPCVRACPTKATFKNENGLVMMDYHRCIGCRFCMAACPYGARSFNWRNPRETYANTTKYKFLKEVNPDFPTRMRGVVEKCNFCAERLAKGQQPACVEACGDTKALVFGDVNDNNSEISKVLANNFTIQRKPALGTKPSVFYIV